MIENQTLGTLRLLLSVFFYYFYANTYISETLESFRNMERLNSIGPLCLKEETLCRSVNFLLKCQFMMIDLRFINKSYKNSVFQKSGMIFGRYWFNYYQSEEREFSMVRSMCTMEKTLRSWVDRISPNLSQHPPFFQKQPAMNFILISLILII